MLRKWLVILTLCAGAIGLDAQPWREGRDFPPYPVSTINQLKSGVKLPAKVNLAKSKYFPDIFEQFGWSCNQSSSIGYLLTYELNRIRNVDGGLPENRYSPFYVWNFLNGTNSGTGVSYFDSWEIIKAGGAPNEMDFPNVPDLKFWMSGYDRYYRAMHNRVLENWSLPVGTPEGLQILKRYLYDHFNGSKFGGMANFQIASGGMSLAKLPVNSYDEGASYITTFGVYVGHALTVVGYNDSIRLDRNGDGEYTNDIDINGDHVIDLQDYEEGALIVANTWGKSWGDNGFAYVPYHLLGRYGWEGGLWNKSVHIVDVPRTVEPVLTLRASLRYTSKSSLRIMAGISNDPSAKEPEHILEFPMFNHQGAQVPFYSTGTPDTTLFEFGLDITPLLDFVETDGPVRIFLIADEHDSWARNEGAIQSMSVYNYFNFTDSTACPDENVEIATNKRTLMSVVRPVRFNRIKIKEMPRLFAKPGEFVSLQMEATGAAEPYTWELVSDYETGFTHAEVPHYEGRILFNGQSGDLVSRVDLPFGFRFYGKEYDHLYVNEDGELLFDIGENDYPYAIDPGLVFRSIRRITGFGGELDYYMQGNSISWYASDTLAAATWKAMVPTEAGGEEVTIVCEIHPDGHVRFIYDKPEVLFPAESPVDLGVSNGDGMQYRRVSFFNPENRPGVNCLDIQPYLYPPDTKFDATGWLFCKPDAANTLYRIRVRLTDKNHRMAYSTVEISTRDLSGEPLLSRIFPNPFTDETHISIVVAGKSAVRADIFDLNGRLVKVLCDGELIPAEYEFTWNGTCNDGTRVSPGVYLCRVRVGDQQQAARMIRTR